MTKSNILDLTAEESDILDHAKKCCLHVKRAGRHSGHMWYCFDCNGVTNASLASQEQHGAASDHKCFDSNRAIKHHMMETHGVAW